MLSDTSYKTHSFVEKPTPFMGGSISPYYYGHQEEESLRKKKEYTNNQEAIKERALKYYYNNKNKVLNYQIDRLEVLKKKNKKIREKYNIRHRSQQFLSLKGQKCSFCDCTSDLQRHHFDNKNPYNLLIVCRKHHNLIHQFLKNIPSTTIGYKTYESGLKSFSLPSGRLNTSFFPDYKLICRPGSHH